MRRRRFAVGDPQAPKSRLLSILDRYGLLTKGDRLADDVFLISIGDHFDYGRSAERIEAADNGFELLSWLASHPPDQVVMIAGNHDLGRVGELADFEDEEFRRAHVAADAAYQGGDTDTELESQLLAEYPALPTAELAARDFAAFSVAQRELVLDLLRQRRLRLAYSEADMLFCHAGITTDYLEALDIAPNASAAAIANELNRRLDQACDEWTGGPMSIPSIHVPGSSAIGEGVGMLYHRPANPGVSKNARYEMSGTMSRRFDARRIPPGLTQVVGHIGDKKCRELLGDWADDASPRGGVLRHMVVTEGQQVDYRHGLPEATSSAAGTMIFIDGGMSRTEIDDYELLEIKER